MAEPVPGGVRAHEVVVTSSTMGSGRCVVTTSWDDGHVYDLRLADLLAERGIAATFYVAPRNVEFPRRALLGDHGLRELAGMAEIGSHSLHHLRFTSLDTAAVRSELRDSRDYLEQLLGREVTSFCYPGGAHLRRHRELVAQAGYRVARTCEAGRLSVEDPLSMPVTMHARALAGWNLDGLAIGRQRPRRLSRHLKSWDALAIDWFDRALVGGGVFHLWGHGWELDSTRSWERLKRVLDHVSGRDEVDYLTNAQVATAMESHEKR